MRHNFVVFGSKDDLYKVSYSAMCENKCTRYISEELDFNNWLLKILYKIHSSERINRFVKIPGRSLWNTCFFRNRFENDYPIVFIFFMTEENKKRLNNGYDCFLRKKYSGCKLVLFCQDLISKSYPYGFDMFSSKFDARYSFDQVDALKYNMTYHPLVYSKYDLIETIKTEMDESDVYFVGKAKDRLCEILKIYEHLSSLGIKCDFNITGVPEKDQKYPELINYCSQMPYIENLMHIRNTKVILEVMQGGGTGYTLRYAEAIMYDRKLITNNKEVKNAEFYSDEMILSYENIEEIEACFILGDNCGYDEKYKNQLSPLEFFRVIEDDLSE